MLGHLLESRGQPIGVLRAHRGQRAQHDQIEGALEKLDFVTHLHYPSKWKMTWRLLACQVKPGQRAKGKGQRWSPRRRSRFEWFRQVLRAQPIVTPSQSLTEQERSGS